MNKNENELDVEKFRQIVKAQLGKDFSTEQLQEILGLAEVVIKIASGEFICKSCGEKYQIYGIRH